MTEALVEMVVVVVVEVVGVVGVVGVHMCAGMDHTTAPHSSREGNVMSAVIWWRPLPSTPHILIDNLRYMDIMYTSQPPRGTN
jgi:hypothetical protein